MTIEVETIKSETMRIIDKYKSTIQISDYLAIKEFLDLMEKRFNRASECCMDNQRIINVLREQNKLDRKEKAMTFFDKVKYLFKK